MGHPLLTLSLFVRTRSNPDIGLLDLDLTFDLTVLRPRQDSAGNELVSAVVRAIGDDALCFGIGDTRQAQQLLLGRRIEIHEFSAFPAFADTLCDGFRVGANFRCRLRRILANLIRIP